MRVLAAMSGGVDSAVAAARVRDAGHEVTGVHLALSRNRQALRDGARGCCTIEDSHDARRAADMLGIPFYIWDMSDRFHEDVDRGLRRRVPGRPHAEPVPALQREDQVRRGAGQGAGAGLRRGRHRPLRAPARRPGRARAAPRRRPGEGPVLRPRASWTPTSWRTRCSRSATTPRPRSAPRRPSAGCTSPRSRTATTSASSRTATPRRYLAKTLGTSPVRSWTAPAAGRRARRRLGLHHRPAARVEDRGLRRGRPAALSCWTSTGRATL